MEEELGKGKNAEYWNLPGRLVPISDFPMQGGFINKERYKVPNYNTKQPKEIALLPCDVAIHFTDSVGFAGIFHDKHIKAGLAVKGVNFSWFSLIPEADGLEGKLNPGVCPDKSRYGRFKLTIDITTLLSKFKNPVVKILGTHAYKLEVMYALVLCEKEDARFIDYPLCPNENVTGSSIRFTSENKFLWSPFTMLDVDSSPWDHLALGIPNDVDVTDFDNWTSCGHLNPNYSSEAIDDAAAVIKVTKLHSVLSDLTLPNFAEESIHGLGDKVAAIDLDTLMTMIINLKAALA